MSRWSPISTRARFNLFAREGTAFAVVRRFNELGLRFPRRSYGGAWNGKLIWGRLTHSRVIGLLHNPSYAGTYVFGRYQSRKEVGPSGEVQTHSRLTSPDAWRIVIPDHHEGYISGDQFDANNQRLSANRTNSEPLASLAREGLCLLQGLLVCGVCGRRIGVRYTGNGGLYPVYQCVWKHREALASRACLSVPAAPLDDVVAARLVDAITPVTLELALAALANLEERDREIGAQWRMRIERARYEADLAERRYEAVDPANRLIAATLEERWNEAVRRLHELESELAAFERKTMRAVTAEQKRQILQLAKDFPRLWTASTTTSRDRKRILRLLARDITVTKGPDPKVLKLHVCWQGGETETITVDLPANRTDAVRYPQEFVDRVRALAVEHHDEEIAALMTAEGRMSSTGKNLTPKIIGWIRWKHRISAPRPHAGTLTVRQASARYGVTSGVVYYWIERGVVRAQQRKRNRRYAIMVDDAADHILRDWVANSNHLPPTIPSQPV